MKRSREEDNDSDITRFFDCIDKGNMAHVQEFIESGIDVNVKDPRNEYQETTSLHQAAQNGHTDIAKVLIQNGADVHAVDEDNQTALYKAAWNGYVDVAKVLIQNAANVNASNSSGSTPLHCAALNGHVDFLKVLIQNGADVNAARIRKRTSLHFATLKGHVEIAKVLIQNGADVNAVDEYNKTALHDAILSGVEIVKVLIQNGADVNAVDKYNKTALHEAAQHGDVVLTLQLLCVGAAIKLKALKDDRTGLLNQINNRMNLLRAGTRPGTSLMSDEERRFMWNLAFSFTIQHPAAAFKAYYTIRSFISFHGIFMSDGYDLGEESIWKRTVKSFGANWW